MRNALIACTCDVVIVQRKGKMFQFFPSFYPKKFSMENAYSGHSSANSFDIMHKFPSGHAYRVYLKPQMDMLIG